MLFHIFFCTKPFVSHPYSKRYKYFVNCNRNCVSAIHLGQSGLAGVSNVFFGCKMCPRKPVNSFLINAM